MKKIGKVGQNNIKARKIIAEICEARGIERCEICSGTFGLAPAHRHPREWYRKNPDGLSDYDQWLALCVECHERMDNRSKTTERQKEDIFNRLRR